MKYLSSKIIIPICLIAFCCSLALDWMIFETDRIEKNLAAPVVLNTLPKNADRIEIVAVKKPIKKYFIPAETKGSSYEISATVYGYSSTVDQTDGNPFKTASGTQTALGTIGNNCLPFGTVVEFDNQKFIILDRMNARYGCNAFDRWFETRQDALNWGRPLKKVKIYKNDKANSS